MENLHQRGRADYVIGTFQHNNVTLKHSCHPTHASNKSIYFFARIVQTERGANGARDT